MPADVAELPPVAGPDQPVVPGGICVIGRDIAAARAGLEMIAISSEETVRKSERVGFVNTRTMGLTFTI